MHASEFLGKIVAFLVAFGACLAAGILVLTGNHAYNDYFNSVLGWGLIAFSILVFGIGALVIVGIVYDARVRQKDQALHVAPRSGPAGPPPAWGMGDVGRVDKVITVGDGNQPRGGGGVMVVSATMVRWDMPLVIAAAFVWTGLLTAWLAPR